MTVRPSARPSTTNDLKLRITERKRSSFIPSPAFDDAMAQRQLDMRAKKPVMDAPSFRSANRSPPSKPKEEEQRQHRVKGHLEKYAIPKISTNRDDVKKEEGGRDNKGGNKITSSLRREDFRDTSRSDAKAVRVDRSVKSETTEQKITTPNHQDKKPVTPVVAPRKTTIKRVIDSDSDDDIKRVAPKRKTKKDKICSKPQVHGSESSCSASEAGSVSEIKNSSPEPSVYEPSTKSIEETTKVDDWLDKKTEEEEEESNKKTIINATTYNNYCPTSFVDLMQRLVDKL